MSKTHLIIGGSRGLGLALAEGVPTSGDTLYTLSRSPASLAVPGVRHNWIAGDVREPEAAERIADALAERALDVCIYNAGIWEAHALREVCRPHGIAVTCLSPGTIESGESRGVPARDVVTMIRAVVSLSGKSCVKELHMPAMADTGV